MRDNFILAHCRAAITERAHNRSSANQEGSCKVQTGIGQALFDTKENKIHLKTSVDGQFFLLSSLAAFLYFGQAFLEEFGEKGIQNPDVLDLDTRIVCTEDPEMDKRFPQEE